MRYLEKMATLFLFVAELLYSLQIQQPSVYRVTPLSSASLSLCFLISFTAFTPFIFGLHQMSKKAQRWLGSIPCWAPPTLLEDGQCYRGDQLKQGFDRGEVLGLDGEDVQHLKRQEVTAGTHWVHFHTNQFCGRK